MSVGICLHVMFRCICVHYNLYILNIWWGGTASQSITDSVSEVCQNLQSFFF